MELGSVAPCRQAGQVYRRHGHGRACYIDAACTHHVQRYGAMASAQRTPPSLQNMCAGQRCNGGQSERLRLCADLTTEAVLVVDDDVFGPCGELERALAVRCPDISLQVQTLIAVRFVSKRIFAIVELQVLQARHCNEAWQHERRSPKQHAHPHQSQCVLA